MVLWSLFCKSKAKSDEERKLFALRGIAGWDPRNKNKDFKGTDEAWKECRSKIIRGWLACEKHLQSRESDFVSKEFVIEALNKIDQVSLKTCQVSRAYDDVKHGSRVFPSKSDLDLRTIC